MKKYTMSFGESIKHKPEHPDRTAKKSVGFDVAYQVWPNRESMARSIRMQQRREYRQDDWRPIIPLTDGEGL